jgi:hypothetical protein
MECASQEDIEVHHVDGDRNNNEPDNLIPLCRDCHMQLHTEGLNGLEKHLKPVSERSHIDHLPIRVSGDLADELHDRKDRGDSYEDVIWELIEEAEEDSREDRHND